MNVWLIEVNTNPCLEESSALLEMLIPRMIDDAFKLTIDLIFPEPKLNESPIKNNNKIKESSFSVENYSN